MCVKGSPSKGEPAPLLAGGELEKCYPDYEEIHYYQQLSGVISSTEFHCFSHFRFAEFGFAELRYATVCRYAPQSPIHPVTPSPSHLLSLYSYFAGDCTIFT